MAEINIKGVIASDENVEVYSWFGYNTASPSSVADQLAEIPDDEDVIVNIGSQGGEVTAGAEIYTMLKNLKNRVEVHITSLAASAASFIAMAGDNILISPVGQIMIHRARSSADGTSSDMSQAGQMLDSTDQMLVSVYKKKTGLSRNRLMQMLKDETWMNADDAVKLGFADGKMFDDEDDDEPKNDVVTAGLYNAVDGQIVLDPEKIAKVKAMLHGQPSDDDAKLTQEDSNKDTQLVNHKLSILFD